VLRLEGEAVALAVGSAARAAGAAVEVVAGVELEARLGRQHLERPPRARVLDERGAHEPGARPVEHEVVVVAAGEQELGVAVAQALADPGGPAEVERRPLDGRELAGRDEAGAGRRVRRGRRREHVVVDGAGALAGEVPADVARQVHDGGRVGDGAEVDAERVAAEPVDDLGLEPAREAHLAGGARVRQREPAVVARLGSPHAPVEALGAAVERVAALVARQLERLPVELEAAAGDPVRVASHHGAEVAARVGEVALEGAEAEDDVRRAALPVRRPQRLHRRPVGEHGHLEPVSASEGEALDRLARGRLAERLASRRQRPSHSRRRPKTCPSSAKPGRSWPVERSEWCDGSRAISACPSGTLITAPFRQSEPG